MKEEKLFIGKALKNARVAKNLSLDKASKETRISQSYLRSIEEDDFSRIPGDVVLKGFIRVYCDFLGMDPKPLIAELTPKTKKEKKEPVSQKKAKPQTFDSERFLKISASVIVLILVFAGLFSFFGYFVNSIRNSRQLKPPVANTLRQVPVGINIHIQIIEKTWLLIESDGKEVFRGIAEAGTEKIFSAEDNIFLKAGNAAGIKVLSNGETLISPGNRGEVVSKNISK